jgi:hypothetical protein
MSETAIAQSYLYFCLCMEHTFIYTNHCLTHLNLLVPTIDVSQANVPAQCPTTAAVDNEPSQLISTPR